jgi:hypothetical protein
MVTLGLTANLQNEWHMICNFKFVLNIYPCYFGWTKTVIAQTYRWTECHYLFG